MTTKAITLDETMAFTRYEAYLLYTTQYNEWLTLGTPDAHYVVPIEPGATDFENALNYAYDDNAMREKRISRLVSGQSVSASPVARTIRVQSRFRLLKSNANGCEMPWAQILTEFRRGRERSYAADLEFRFVRADETLKIAQKVVRLINSTEALAAIGHILLTP